MAERTLVASGTNLLARGFLVVPTDRKSPAGEPTNGLFAVARAIRRIVEQKPPARAVAVVSSAPPPKHWPPILVAQLAPLEDLLRALGLRVVKAEDEHRVVASYARAALEAGDDVVIAGVDKRYAQLVSDGLKWYDANKDVFYTPEIVQKRFGVPPENVAEWLGLVGDDDSLPGVAGIGAKGATGLLEKYGSVAEALKHLDDIGGRSGNALRAALDAIPVELARATLDARPLPAPLAPYREPENVNDAFARLGFVELLVAGGGPRGPLAVCETEEAFLAELEKIGSDAPAVYLLGDGALRLGPSGLAQGERNEKGSDPFSRERDEKGSDPFSQDALAGVAVSRAGHSLYVPRGTKAWAALVRWLEDPSARKLVHDAVTTTSILHRAGIRIAEITADSESASHLTQPSNWAPHELPILAKFVLGRALPEEEQVLGTGVRRKTWSKLPVERAAELAAERAATIAEVWQKLSTDVDPAHMREYLDLAQVLVRMEETGILVDREELARAEQSFAEMEDELGAEIAKLAGHEFNINSSPQLGKVLFEELKLPVVSHTKTGWSTSIDALTRIENAHPIVPLVMRWRALRRLRDNWIESLRRHIHSDGRVHSSFHHSRSFSGDLINMAPDLSRVPGRTPEMQRIRRAFVAPPGHVLMSIDFHQLGLYVLAHLTKDPALVEPLRAGADMHTLTAQAILEKESITLEERQIGKVVNFATFAGQGSSALSMQLGISPAEAREMIARFDRRYSRVRAFQDEQFRLAKERGYVTLISGRRWPIGGLESLDSMLQSYAERLARRATHEGSVADVSRRALLHADRALREAGLKATPVHHIVDEALFDVPKEELEQAAKLASNAMRHAYELEVPLVVGVEAGPNWADLVPRPA